MEHTSGLYCTCNCSTVDTTKYGRPLPLLAHQRHRGQVWIKSRKFSHYSGCWIIWHSLLCGRNERCSEFIKTSYYYCVWSRSLQLHAGSHKFLWRQTTEWRKCDYSVMNFTHSARAQTFAPRLPRIPSQGPGLWSAGILSSYVLSSPHAGLCHCQIMANYSKLLFWKHRISRMICFCCYFWGRYLEPFFCYKVNWITIPWWPWSGTWTGYVRILGLTRTCTAQCSVIATRPRCAGTRLLLQRQ